MRDLSMHVMDIVQNSLTAKATRVSIEIIEDINDDVYTIIIEDNGIGMSRDYALTISDPYVTSRTTRKVGLGIPLLKQNAERTGGNISIDSKEGEGTIVRAFFSNLHPDRPPLGDIAGTIVLLCAANPLIEINYKHITHKGEYLYNTTAIMEELDGISISEPSVVRFLKEMINENLEQIGVSK